ncbi:MAG: putative toxin-antitoxin system toxin component, PIN family [Pyrinomonadaceae bacterium]
MRVTADTNTVISGSLWHGNPRRILDAAHDGLIELFTCRQLLVELEDVLGRGKFAQRLASADRTVKDVVENYSFVATIVEIVKIKPVVICDPDDDVVIACAIESQSDVIVSGDDDLLDLKEYRSVRILMAIELLAELKL